MDIIFKNKYVNEDALVIDIKNDTKIEDLVELNRIGKLKKIHAFKVSKVTPENLTNVLKLMSEIENVYSHHLTKFIISIYTDIPVKKFSNMLYSFLNKYLEKNCVQDDDRITRPETLYRLNIPIRQQEEGVITFEQGSTRIIVAKMVFLFGIILENMPRFLNPTHESAFVQYLVDNNAPYLATLFYLRRGTNITNEIRKLSRDIHFHYGLDTKRAMQKTTYIPALKLIRDDYGAKVRIVQYLAISDIARSVNRGN